MSIIALTYRPVCGDNIQRAVAHCIKLAQKYNRAVIMNFNDHKLKITKRLSVKHVVSQYFEMTNAACVRYYKSAEYLKYQAEARAAADLAAKKRAEIETKAPKHLTVVNQEEFDSWKSVNMSDG